MRQRDLRQIRKQQNALRKQTYMIDVDEEERRRDAVWAELERDRMQQQAESIGREVGAKNAGNGV